MIKNQRSSTRIRMKIKPLTLTLSHGGAREIEI